MEGILPFVRADLPVEVIAGCTLAALAIPETMGYATIAGMPVITGLYTLLLPILLFALFGSSRHLVVGADSATAAILATGLAGMGLVAGSSTYVEMASFAALIAALLLITARILRLGFIANFLSSSVLIGFLTGVGIQVAMGQVGGMFGITGATGTTIEKFIETIKLIPLRDTGRHPAGVGRGPGHHPGPAEGQREDPRRPHRGHRLHRPELCPEPRGQGRDDRRDGALGPALARPPDRTP